MNLPASSALPTLPGSTFYMLRCVVAIARADNIVKQEELLFIRALISHFKRHMQILPEQMAQLKEDLKFHQPIDALLPHVTEKGDREQLVLFAGLLAQADGDVHPSEDEILQKIHAWCGEGTAAPAPGGAVHANAIPAEPASHVANQAPVLVAPSFDMHGFMAEVRDTVKQEVFKQAIRTSGVGQGTRHVAVVDAFAEKSPAVPHKDSYEVMVEESKLSRDMQHSLVPDERLLARGRFHWVYGAFTGIVVVLSLALTGPAQKAWTSGTEKAKAYLTSGQANWLGVDNIPRYYGWLDTAVWAGAPKYLLLTAALLFALWRLAVWRTTEIIVTDSRVVVKQGVFRIKTFKSDLTQLGQVDVDQSLLGKILGYGSIHIFTRNFSGKGNEMEAEGIYLPPLADPHNFSTQIDRARRMWRTRSV